MQYTVDLHTHTIASGHAYSTLQENLRHASDKGMKVVAVTDHGMAMPGGPIFIYFQNLRILPREMYGVKLLRGVEANIIDYTGGLDVEEPILKKLDIVIASYHEICIPPATKEEHTNGLLAVLDNEYVDIIGHAGNPSFDIDIPAFVARAVERDKLIEINNSSLSVSRKGSDVNCLKIAIEAKKQGAKLILSSDAHLSSDVGKFSSAIALIREAGVPDELIMNTPEKIKTFLEQRGKGNALKSLD